MGNSQEQTDKLVFQTNQIHQTYVGYSQSFNSLQESIAKANKLSVDGTRYTSEKEDKLIWIRKIYKADKTRLNEINQALKQNDLSNCKGYSEIKSNIAKTEELWKNFKKVGYIFD